MMRMLLALLLLAGCSASLEAVEEDAAHAGQEYADFLGDLGESATTADWLCERFTLLEEEAAQAADSTEALVPRYHNTYSPMRDHTCELSRMLEELPITRRGER